MTEADYKERKKRCCVTLADDELSMRNTLKTLLMRSGCTVMAADDNGQSAMHSYQKYKPDIVALDLDMPGEMSGLDVLMKIREVDKTTYIVIISGKTDGALVREVVTAGASNFVVKPFTIGRIEDMLAQYHAKAESS